MSFVINAAAGFLCGIISGFGIGGGTLLVIYMTNLAMVPQSTAQGINLLYFLPTSSGALISHFKRKLIHPMVVWSILAGIVTTALGAYAANVIEGVWLKKAYGIFLLYIGIRELFSKRQKQQ
ncbi:MAG: sulfite exporter TauE/SafE family protein [Ruminococcaceae bacterium]|nr:sulfite exporter TauE/SafE family protein [Oscillospiraceae bacterium]